MQETRCVYVIAVMSFYWMTEALPLQITALIPVFGFPFLGVLSSKGKLKIKYTVLNICSSPSRQG